MAYSRKKWAVAKRKNAALMRLILEKLSYADSRGEFTCSDARTMTECSEPSVVIDLEAERKKTKDLERKRAIAWVQKIKGWKTTKRVVIENGDSFKVVANLCSKAKTMVVRKLYFRGPAPMVRNKKKSGRTIRRSKRIGKWRVYYHESVMNRNTWSVQYIRKTYYPDSDRGKLATRWSNEGDFWTRKWGKRNTGSTR